MTYEIQRCGKKGECVSLAEKLISGFYEEEKPHFRQGAPKHELEELVTAEEVTGYVEQIVTLRAALRELIEQAQKALGDK